MELKMAVLSVAILLAFSPGTGYAEAEKTEPKQVAAEPVAAGKSEANPVNAKLADKVAPAAKPSNTSDLVAVSGKVVETHDGGSYTYFLMEKDGKRTWVAVPAFKAKVGDEMSFRPGIQMGEFKSAILNRTFDNIIFSAGPVLPEGTKGNDDFLMKRAHSKRPAVDPAPAAVAAPEVKTAPKPELLTGKVVEKHDGGGYSYFLLENDGKKTWVAAPPTAGKVGDVMSFQPGFEMKEFKSKALDKTFSSIMFTDGVVQEDAKLDPEQVKKKAHEVLKQETAKPVGQDGKPLDLAVEKSTAPNGYTVAELYEKSGALNGKEVVVTGKVVKVSKQIMGKNWVHLQDGSGDTASGTNKLVTTTQDVVVVGDVVTATGKLAKDKDFGGGYQYAVIVEEASFTKK
jgi:hypothetical protein